MYNFPKQGYTVNITKEKFLNTYPPLFNTLFVAVMRRAGYFFALALVLSGIEGFDNRKNRKIGHSILPGNRPDTNLTQNLLEL